MRRRRDDRGPVPAIVLLAALGLALAGLAAALAGCGGGDAAPGAASSSPAASSEPVASPEPVTTAVAGDALPPGTQAVYLLGGSSARECVESNAAWGEAIRAAGGPAALAVDLGATNQSFSADRRLVQGMPKGSVVLIGVSLGRYTSPPPRALGDKPLDRRGPRGARR